MRTRLIAVMLALCSVVALGCASNVGQQLKTEREGFNLTLAGIHTAHVSGALSTTREAALLPDLKVAQDALDAGDKAYLAGDTSTASTYLKAIVAALARVATNYTPAAK